MCVFAVIAVIAATLFPLWPAEMRVGVYYLSVAAGCFVASILLLAVGTSSRLYFLLFQFQMTHLILIPPFPFPSARCILFLIIWLVTGGRHHFWFLPNLTADVGFIDSFRPLYTHEYKGPRSSSKKSSGEKSDKGSDSSKAQKSDSEDKSDSEKKDGEEEEDEDENKETEEAGAERQSDTDSDRREDEGSQHSNGNDFEMITREELEQHTEEDEEEEEDDEEAQSDTKPLTVQT